MASLSASVRENSFNELNVLVEINKFVYTRTSLSEFVYENEINKQPHGSFILKDSGQLDESMLQSGSYGILYFTNTSDRNELKRMAMPIYIEESEFINKVDIFIYYKIKWKAGSIQQQSIRDNDVIAQSNSTDAIRKIFELRDVEVEPYSGSRPTDNMNWILTNKNMWQQLESVVNRSILPNDYIFWAWDEVNNNFRVSSLLKEFSTSSEQLIIRSIDALASTSDVREITKNNISIWRYNEYKKNNILGSSYKSIFPNVSFLSVPGGTIQNGSIRSQNFITLLTNLNDNKIQDVLEQTEIDPNNAKFGDLIIRKQSINGHKLYSIADIYRDYKVSTYAKIFICRIYNSVGPKVGSSVSLLHMYNTSEGKLEIDYNYSDKYFIKKKIVQYDGVSTNNVGRKLDAVTNYVTTLFLASDNYGENRKYIEGVLERTVV